jgi:signal peptidase II
MMVRLADSKPRALPHLFGPLTHLGFIAAFVTAVLDQASKFWVLVVLDLASKRHVPIAPMIDFVLTRNTGISYGWFQQEGPFGQWALLALKAVAVALLWIWLARANSRLTAIALGLIIGGAIGNAVDRLTRGAVIDFVLFHISTASWHFSWYVFNLADAAIVAGVAGLLYDSVFGDRAAKAP